VFTGAWEAKSAGRVDNQDEVVATLLIKTEARTGQIGEGLLDLLPQLAAKSAIMINVS
jgi:hypothetical protein